MTYGGYQLDPAPMMTLSMSHIRNEAGELIDILHTASLQGKLVSLGKPNPGVATLLDLENDMRIAFTSCTGCQLFEFSCDNVPLISAYARVNSLSFSPSSDNWVFTANYDLELQWHAVSDILLISGLVASGINKDCLSCLSSTEETWEVTVPDNPARYYLVDCTGTLGAAARNRDVVEVSHTVSAKGYNCCVSGVFTNGWESAKEWVLDRIGYTSQILTDISGAFYFAPADFTTYNHSRTVSVNKGGGDFAVSERWTVLGNSGVPACLEDFSVNVETDNTTRFTNVSINGTITGLESRNSHFEITKTKFQAAEECWDEISPILYNRVNCIASPSCILRTTPTRSSVGKNPTAGVITYSYNYDSKPQFVAGSLSEQISVSDTLASEQVVQIPILGRRSGPIIYPLGSNNALEKRANISILMAATGCYSGDARTVFCNMYNAPNTSGINNLLCCLEQTMSGAGYTYYRTSDTQEYNVLEGQLSRSVVWNYFKCTTPAPSGFCG